MPKGNYKWKSFNKWTPSANMARRRHCCETCGGVFICNECTDAMIKCIIRGGNMQTLYSDRHTPGNTLGGGHRSEWLCGACS